MDFEIFLVVDFSSQRSCGRAATGCLPKEIYLTAASVNVSCHPVETIRVSVTDVVAWDGERVT